MRYAITRPPSRSLAECALTYLEPTPIDFDRAARQHAAYRECLDKLGISLLTLPEEESQPDACFVEDVAIVLDELALITRPGLEQRREECPSLMRALEPLRRIEHIEEPGTLDGGDVMQVEDVLYVSMSSRTNHAGLKSLAHKVLAYGYRVKAVTTKGCLHLKTACCHLGQGKLLANPEWLDEERFAGFEILHVHPSEPFAANALVIGEAVVHPKAFPRTAEMLADHGLRVVAIDLEELQKAEAGPTCLSLVFEAQP